ncbi:hypothetical protein PQR04_04200 [Paraburkholderia sediminicola]
MSEFDAQHQSALIFHHAGERLFVTQFLAPCLKGKIGLAVCNDGLRRVTVLDDQVACVAGKPEIFDGTLGARTHYDHFSHLGKMVVNAMPRALASHACLLDDTLEFVPCRVVEKWLKFSR